jgi:hypothetical protein
MNGWLLLNQRITAPIELVIPDESYIYLQHIRWLGLVTRRFPVMMSELFLAAAPGAE